MQNQDSSSSSSSSDSYVRITLKQEQAQRIQDFLGSFFGGAPVEMDLGKLKDDLDDLQARLWHAIYCPTVENHSLNMEG